MDYEKLIERLNGLYTALREEGEQKCSPEINTVAFVLMDAAEGVAGDCAPFPSMVVVYNPTKEAEDPLYRGKK